MHVDAFEACSGPSRMKGGKYVGTRPWLVKMPEHSHVKVAFAWSITHSTCAFGSPMFQSEHNLSNRLYEVAFEEGLRLGCETTMRRETSKQCIARKRNCKAPFSEPARPCCQSRNRTCTRMCCRNNPRRRHSVSLRSRCPRCNFGTWARN